MTTHFMDEADILAGRPCMTWLRLYFICDVLVPSSHDTYPAFTRLVTRT